MATAVLPTPVGPNSAMTCGGGTNGVSPAATGHSVPVMASARVQLDGATALVTGASGGLGQAIAIALAERGASVIASGRRKAELELLASEIGGRAVVADLAARHEIG